MLVLLVIYRIFLVRFVNQGKGGGAYSDKADKARGWGIWQMLTLHSVETCGRTNILAQSLFKTLLQKVFEKMQKMFSTSASIWLIRTTKIIGLDKFLEKDQL